MNLLYNFAVVDVPTLLLKTFRIIVIVLTVVICLCTIVVVVELGYISPSPTKKYVHKSCGFTDITGCNGAMYSLDHIALKYTVLSCGLFMAYHFHHHHHISTYYAGTVHIGPSKNGGKFS